jgi:hypothetical protein
MMSVKSVPVTLIDCEAEADPTQVLNAVTVPDTDMIGVADDPLSVIFGFSPGSLPDPVALKSTLG